jgi:RNA recognition motif-containing protein
MTKPNIADSTSPLNVFSNSYGFAYVNFSSEEEATRALQELNGYEIGKQ